jgi:pyridoxine 5-phosphate synthase
VTVRCELSVNVDHVATLRQARGGREPDPVRAAELALQAGAEGITVHLREDRRHIQDHDLTRLREVKRGVLNLEMALTEEMVGIAIAVRPDRVTLVPEKRAELTTEGGLSLRPEAAAAASMTELLKRLTGSGIPVSLFLDPDESIADLARGTGATFVEIHTGHYANARGADTIDRELQRIQRAAEGFAAAGLRVHAGHGLDTGNVTALLHRFPFQELAIGYSIVSRSIELGMAGAVREMIDAIRAA